MGILSIPEEVVERAKKEIRDALDTFGADYPWHEIRARYPEVQKGTFYRWVKSAQGIKQVDHVADERKARKAKKEVAAHKAKVAAAPKPTREQRKQAVVELDAELPAVVTLADLQTDGFAGVASRIDSCITHAERVLKACEKDDGKIVNPKLYLQASTHILRSMDTASRVVGMLMDAERTRKYNEIMLRRIAARDPEVVRLILADMRALNEQLGVAIG